LVEIGEIWAVIAGIADVVIVSIRLVRIGDVWAVVIALANAVFVCKVITTDASQGAFEHQDCVRCRSVLSPAETGVAGLAGPLALLTLGLDQLVGEVVIPASRLFGVPISFWISSASNLILPDPLVTGIGHDLESLRGGPQVIVVGLRKMGANVVVVAVIVPQPGHG